MTWPSSGMRKRRCCFLATQAASPSLDLDRTKRNEAPPDALCSCHFKGGIMVRGFILWLLGVPLVGVIILYLLGYL